MRLHDVYLIQGIFFQEHSQIGVACLPLEGNVGVLRTSLAPFMYAGFLERDPEHTLGGYKGCVRDDLGRAQLMNVYLSDERLSFKKLYEHGKPHVYPIEYVFSRTSGSDQFLFDGDYSIEAVQVQGRSHCILTPVQPSFFEPSRYHYLLTPTQSNTP